MRLHLGLAALLLGTAFASAAEPDVEFGRDIRPILSNRCFKCHGPATQEGGIRLDVRDDAIRRRAFVPGNVEASKLIRRVTSDDEDRRMPPAEAGKPLTADEVARLKAWVAAGAPYAPHWAFVTPKAARLPAVRQRDWPRNPIDYFVLARLEAAGLRPSPEADRVTLARRLWLDLLGLLPEPAEVDAFVNDPAPDAYERLVDRLLASPHYGERQARHWLDMARYADSNGYTIDGARSIWPWRDWVIDAYNRDLPFDQFTLQQLAGDLLPDATDRELVATGFHRNTSFNEEGGTDPEQFRVERTIDRTNTTGSVWLGLTVGCAQCHDHKYDPVSQKEYYQLYAFFNQVDEPKLNLPKPDQEQRLKELRGQLAAARKEAATPPGVKPTDVETALGKLRVEAKSGWQVLVPTEAESKVGATLTVRPDHSILASGEVPDSDVYIVKANAPAGSFTALRLEALTDPSLPMKGPGRAGNGNFVLSHLILSVDGTPVTFRGAAADHSQKNYDVANALRGDLTKGWAISTDRSQGSKNVNREAVFFADKPIELKEGQLLAFTMSFSESPKKYPLGRFRLSLTDATEKFLDLPVAAQRVVLMEPDKRQPADVKAFQTAVAAGPAAEKVKQLEKQLKAAEAEVASTLILRENAAGRQTHIHRRGDFLDKGDPVQPDGFAVLPPLAKTDGKADRLALARWLVSADQPLTPRVVMNRMWQHYFGKGLVETENDFGMQGTLPTHPELLDWLAVDFVRGGWGMKRMHRLIVTSATYRQASVARADLHERDPLNKLLGRQNRLRLEAEIIRDAALAASGLFSPRVGGPGVYPPQPPEVFSFTQSRRAWPESQGPDRYRRGMYTYIWRQSQHPLLTTFDGPDAQTACTRRNRSNTPLQALHLANDPTFVEIAGGLAKRLLRDGPSDDAGRMEWAFRLCLARTPTPAERDRLLRYLDEQRGPDPESAWTLVARVLLNLDEFITRE